MRLPALSSTLLAVTLAAVAAATAAATASAATTRGSFAEAPFYDGKVPAGITRVVHAPVAFVADPTALDPTPARSPALAALVDSLAAALDRDGRTRRLDLPPSGAPDIRFGCRRGGMTADGEPLAPSEIDPSEPRRMTFEVEGPGKAWRERLRAAGDTLDAVLVVQVRFDDYWVRQEDWKGTKSIQLGTRRAMPIPWLTSLDDPVQVLALTGALVSREGRVLRVGAEGLLAQRTGMTASVAGVQEVLAESDLERLFSPEGDDRETSDPETSDDPESSGDPVWRTALGALVAQLLAPGDAPR